MQSFSYFSSMAEFSENSVLLLLENLQLTPDVKWDVKEKSLKILTDVAKALPERVSFYLPEIVPIVTDCMHDLRPSVKRAAKEALLKSCLSIGNKDIEPFVPHLIEAISNSDQIAECVHKLSATTFVQTVDARTLAVLVPLLCRSIVDRTTVVKRKTCVIINNMAKLVDDPADAFDFSDKLISSVKNAMESMSNPEARTIATTCYEYLHNLHQNVCAKLSTDDIRKYVASNIKTSGEHEKLVVSAVDGLVRSKVNDIDAWTNALKDVLSFEDISNLFEAFETTTEQAVKETEPGEDLCDCEFSLAYGGKILLNSTRLNIKRGNRYGLIGPNGAGKSTLMRAIANGQLEGFPDSTVVRTVYVEHDIDASDSNMSVYDFLMSDVDIMSRNPTKEHIVKKLEETGFDEKRRASSINSLSGGWKMKLALTRAMLMNADVLLLDEPTNHLDVANVAWLVSYLTSLTNVSSLVVSHDSGFLDAICSAIIHYEPNLKLQKYIGNLSAFVKKRPEAASYYDLKDTRVKWAFPEPGFLEGVTSKDRAIIKLRNVSFTYPGGASPIFSDVHAQVSMNSRIGVIGPNGAGKSTLIKVLTGETQATNPSSVWKHPNMRMAYVAQHAFHHIEDHLDMTPNQYIQWRYASGEDLEAVDRGSRHEDTSKMYEVKVVNGVKRTLDRMGGRRKLKRSYEYEVFWKGDDSSQWMSRDVLEDLGFQKLLNDIDAKEAAANGLMGKPLTAKNVEDHMVNIGLDPEFTTHSRIRGLSGGQKVKLVIGAALWQHPHVIILDEPTNYLDRESLGALAEALETFGGGVVIISHSTEFVKKVCSEMWTVGGGVVNITGQSAATIEATKLEMKRETEYVDALGNTHKVKEEKRELSRQEKKKRAKERKMKRDRGEEVSDSDDDY
jgi:elongation factor 3